MRLLTDQMSKVRRARNGWHDGRMIVKITIDAIVIARFSIAAEDSSLLAELVSMRMMNTFPMGAIPAIRDARRRQAR